MRVRSLTVFVDRSHRKTIVVQKRNVNFLMTATVVCESRLQTVTPAKSTLGGAQMQRGSHVWQKALSCQVASWYMYLICKPPLNDHFACGAAEF